MRSVEPCPLPAHALLARHAGGGGYTDGFTTTLARAVTLAAFVEAFYTSWLFRLERAVLARLFACPSTDAEAAELASGKRQRFAAWTVEARGDDQILLRDRRGRTRSWLMVDGAQAGPTRLYFGSAIEPVRPGSSIRALLGLHRFYSRALLRAAARRLERSRVPAS